jgi:hypothetical protein
MDELKAIVPTYYGDAHSSQIASGDLKELSEPYVPFVVRVDSGIRIVLGTHEFDDISKPDILIERRPRGWAIMLHPLPGSDPSGCVYFLDDGRSVLVPESDFCATTPIEVRKEDACVPEVDDDCA